MKNHMSEFDEIVNSGVHPKDIFEVYTSMDERLKILPNSTSYEDAYLKFNTPFYIQLDELNFGDSVAVGLSLDQVIEMRDFLNEKIEMLINMNKGE